MSGCFGWNEIPLRALFVQKGRSLSVFSAAGKTYLGRGEEVLRKKVWESNLQIVQQHNALADQGKATYHMGMNAYADLVR